MLTIDLNQRLVPNNGQIFCVYSGRHRRFFQEFSERSIVFLETPDMHVSPTILNNDNELRRHIRRSVAMSDMINELGSARPRDFPIENYDGLPHKDDRTVNSLIGSFKLLFKNAKVGDLIISPESGTYREILFGEIVTDPDPKDRISLSKFSGLSTPFRRVKWIKRRDASTALPENLSRLLSRRPAVSKIIPDDETDEFYDIAYGDYVNNRSSRMNIFSPDYAPKNFYAVNSINHALSVILATHNAVSAQIPAEQLLAMTETEIVHTFLRDVDVLYIKQLFASPGNTSIKSRVRELAPLIGTLMTIFLAGSAAQLFNKQHQAVQIQIENSSHPAGSSRRQSELNDEFCDSLSESVRLTAEALGLKRCLALQKVTQSANEELGTEVTPKVVP